jgi:hypothetical protein
MRILLHIDNNHYVAEVVYNRSRKRWELTDIQWEKGRFDTLESAQRAAEKHWLEWCEQEGTPVRNRLIRLRQQAQWLFPELVKEGFGMKHPEDTFATDVWETLAEMVEELDRLIGIIVP